MTKSRTAFAAATLAGVTVALMAAGCAPSDPESAPAASPVPSVTSQPLEDLPRPSATTSATPGRTGTPGRTTRPPRTGEPIPKDPPGAGGSATTMRGTVTTGTRTSCLLLNGYLLVGGDRAVIRQGATVSVTGRVDPAAMTTCQEGTPFLVTSAAAG